MINSIANIAGLGLPPVMGWIKDTTQSYDYALLLVAVALLAGGMLGLYLGGQRKRQVMRDVILEGHKNVHSA